MEVNNRKVNESNLKTSKKTKVNESKRQESKGRNERKRT